jgi:uncharacterized membrane protein YkvA (DUF1232 family)
LPLKITFELSDADLRHFRKVMRSARTAARSTSEETVITGARELLSKVRASDVPDFVRERLLSIDVMIAMLEDADWAITGGNRERVVSALAYFNEPVDLIPDHIPGFGFLDDAVMVQLVVDELKPDFDSYTDFCAFRKELDKGRRRTAERNSDKQASLETRRKQLHGRMRRRRDRGRSRRASSRKVKSPFSLW